MYQVETDTRKNRLYITIGDLPKSEDKEALVKAIGEKASLLKQGFDCVTDLRNYEVMPEEAEEFIYRAQKILTDAGMANVVRVVKKFGSLAHFQFDKISIDLGYHAQNANTMEEAEALLDEKK